MSGKLLRCIGLTQMHLGVWDQAAWAFEKRRVGHLGSHGGLFALFGFPQGQVLFDEWMMTDCTMKFTTVCVLSKLFD